MKNYYEILGIKPNATQEAIKKAYLRMAKKTHPDKKGGNAEAFDEIKKAFDALYDSDTRAEYDATGEVKQKIDDRPEVIGMLSNLFMQKIESHYSEFKDVDYIALMQKDINNTIGLHNGDIKGLSTNIDKMEKVKAKVIKKNGGENLLTAAIDSRISDSVKQIEARQKAIKYCEQMLLMLEDYEMLMQLSIPNSCAQQSSGSATFMPLYMR